MTPRNVLCERQQPPVRSFAYECWRAIASPGRALSALCRWTVLAQLAGLPCAELLRYRRELVADREFLHTAWDDFCGRHGLRAGRVGHLGVTRKPGIVWT